MSDAQQLVNTKKKILLATAAIVAFSAPSFAAETAKTVLSVRSIFPIQPVVTVKRLAAARVFDDGQSDQAA
jgi:hypothetical protein